MCIHIQRGSDSFGPYTSQEVKDYLVGGVLVPTDLAWQEGLPAWVPLSEFPGVEGGIAVRSQKCSWKGLRIKATAISMGIILVGTVAVFCLRSKSDRPRQTTAELPSAQGLPPTPKPATVESPAAPSAESTQPPSTAQTTGNQTVDKVGEAGTPATEDGATGILAGRAQPSSFVPTAARGADRATMIKVLKLRGQPAFGLTNILVVVEQRLAEKSEVRDRVERYAEDIWKAYGVGVEVVSLSSSSSRYLKGIVRSRMASGLSGAVFVGNVPKAYGELFEVQVPRDIFLCDLYFMNQNTQPLPGGGWEDPGWLDEGRPAFAMVMRQAVSTIDVDWGQTSPHPGVVPTNGFSVRYAGAIVPPSSGVFTFVIRSGNGVRLTVKGSKIIDEWSGGRGGDYQGTVDLKAGVAVPILLDYFKNHGSAEVHLSWTPAGKKTVSTVPASAFANLKAYYYNNMNLKVDTASRWGRCYARNGVFDRVTDGTRHGGNPEKMAPNIFVSRIETHTSSSFGEEVALLTEFFDKDHAYWSGSLHLGSRAILSFGSGSRSADPVVVDRLLRLFETKSVDVRFDPRDASQYLQDLTNPDYLVSVYCGHGWENGLGLGLDSQQLSQVNVQPLFVDLESCSPLRTIRASERHPDGEDLTAFIGGAHLFGDRGKGHCLAVKGATKTSGGNQHEEFFYASLSRGSPVGVAFVDWARGRMRQEGNPAEWFDWFYPQALIGDPMIVIGPALGTARGGQPNARSIPRQ